MGIETMQSADSTLLLVWCLTTDMYKIDVFSFHKHCFIIKHSHDIAYNDIRT